MPFLIATRFPGVSPQEVPNWDAEMVEDALERIEIEAVVEREEHEREERRRKAAASGSTYLGDDFPELDTEYEYHDGLP